MHFKLMNEIKLILISKYFSAIILLELAFGCQFYRCFALTVVVVLVDVFVFVV